MRSCKGALLEGWQHYASAIQHSKYMIYEAAAQPASVSVQ